MHVLRGIVHAHRVLLYVNHKIAVNVVYYVFVCSDDIISQPNSNRDCFSNLKVVRYLTSWLKVFLGLLLNQYLIEDLKSLPQSQENWPS